MDFLAARLPACYARLQEKVPGAKEGGEPLPEGMLWLLLTGEVRERHLPCCAQPNPACFIIWVHGAQPLLSHTSRPLPSYSAGNWLSFTWLQILSATAAAAAGAQQGPGSVGD